MTDDRTNSEIIRDFNFTIQVHDGGIRMEFRRPIDWVVFTPERARKVADMLNVLADRVEKEQQEKQAEEPIMN